MLISIRPQLHSSIPHTVYTSTGSVYRSKNGKGETFSTGRVIGVLAGRVIPPHGNVSRPSQFDAHLDTNSTSILHTSTGLHLDGLRASLDKRQGGNVLHTPSNWCARWPSDPAARDCIEAQPFQSLPPKKKGPTGPLIIILSTKSNYSYKKLLTHKRRHRHRFKLSGKNATSYVNGSPFRPVFIAICGYDWFK